MQDHDAKVAAQLFGTRGKMPRAGGHKVKPWKLHEALEGPDSVMYLFCEGCGITCEITHEGLALLRSESEETLEIDPARHYWHARVCPICGDDFGRPTIRTIPPLEK